MTRFTDRVERDLAQISDRATPSSSAWEAIQARIAEQAPTQSDQMEVIMLTPNDTPPRRNRVLFAAAAGVAVLALVGGLIAITGRDDDQVPADSPEPSPTVVDPDAEPIEGQVDDELVGEALPLPLANSGQMIADCDFQGTSQLCDVVDDGALPIDPIQNLRIEFFGDDASLSVAEAIYGTSSIGHVYGGYVHDSNHGRFVSMVPGVDDYADQVIHIVGDSPGSGRVTFDWYVGDGPQPFGAVGDFDTIEVAVTCEPTASTPEPGISTETCSYVSDDPRVPVDPTTVKRRTLDVGAFGDATGAVTYFATESAEDGTVTGGLTDDAGVRRWAGATEGPDGLIHAVGWAQTDSDGTSSGVIQMSFPMPTD